MPAAAQTNAPSDAELAIKKFQVADGLKVEVFAAEPLLQNPVAFSIDEKGRVFVAETHRYREAIFDITKNLPWLLDDLAFRTVAERSNFLARTFATNNAFLTKDSELIRLVEDTDGDGKADTSRVFADGFRDSVSGTAAGVLARKGTVWFTCIPDLWRFDEDVAAQSARAASTPHPPPSPLVGRGERVPEGRVRGDASPGASLSDPARKSPIANRKLASGFGVRIGVSGHDLHGLILGPDGKLYFSVGDRGFESPPGIRGFGFTTNFLQRVLPDTGSVLRCNPDGSDLEVFAVGLRNPQELAFDAFGNLFTVDNDTAGADNSRVLHVVEGGDYGWRVSYQHMEGFGPWVREGLWRGGLDDVLPPAGVVAQGPSGLAYNPGTGLGPKYRDAFLVCDFPGGVWAFKARPKGASYEVAWKEKLLWNLWPTDVAFANDGSVLVSDWTEGWSPSGKGRLYRISDPNQPDKDKIKETQQFLERGIFEFTYEQMHQHLLNPHMEVRMMARRTHPLNNYNDQTFTESLARVIDTSTNRHARFDALWGLAERGPRINRWPYIVAGGSALMRLRSATIGKIETLFNDTDPLIGAQAAKVISECRWSTRNPWFPPLLEHTNVGVRYNAALGVGVCEVKSALPPLLNYLRTNADADPFLTHAGVMALVGIADLSAIGQAGKDASPAVRRAALLAMRRLERPEIAQFLSDPDPRLRYEAARAINDVPIEAALPELANFVAKIDCPTNVMSRAINACFRLGTERHAKMLSGLGVRVDMPDWARAEAISVLGDWKNPPPLDRIVGLWRPLESRNEQAAKRAFLSVASDLLGSKFESIQLAIVRTAVKLKARELAHGMFERFQNTNTPPLVRREIPAALAELFYHNTGEAVRLALADTDIALRREGVRLVGQAAFPDAAGVLENLLNTEKDTRLKQAALTALGELEGDAADAALQRQMQTLAAGKLRAELHLDLLEAAAKRRSATLQAAVKVHEDARPAGDVLRGWRELLSGGDAQAGKKVFFERAEAECLRCHKLAGQGGTVGPALDGVGKRLTAEQILESIVHPNRAHTPGYENVIVTLKDGGTMVGLLQSQTETELVILSPEDGAIKVSRTNIKERRAGLSAMPEGLAQRLPRRDLRDLVAYLSAVK
jgi:quinoprotein glucose dehydrogenase